MGNFTWWNFPRKAWLIIIAELSIIVSLAASIYITYIDNLYFQTYVNSLSPILVPILSVAFGISSASIATYLYLGMKRIRVSGETETAVRKRLHPRKTAKRPLRLPSSQPKVSDLPPVLPARLKPIAPPSHVQQQKPSSKEKEDDAPNPEARKQS